MIKTRKHIHIVKSNLFDNLDKYIYSTNNGCSIIVPHVCNNVGVFGGGFTKELSEKYPVVKENYHLLGNNFLKHNLGYTQYIETLKNKEYGYKLIFANMIAQNGLISTNNPRPLNYGALVRCMESVANYIKILSKTLDHDIQIHCPKFGCGLAGGNWDLICNLIEDIWNKYTVTAYIR